MPMPTIKLAAAAPIRARWSMLFSEAEPQIG
jgi:hypothetical protein